MARQLLIGDGTTVAYTNGLLADGAIDIQKLSSDGPTSLAIGDTVADSDQIRFVQGGPSGIDVNIVSPWVYGRDLQVVSGRSGAAQTAEQARIALAGNAAAIGQHTIKLINLTNGEAPFEFDSFEIEVDPAGTNTPTEQCTAFTTAINNNLPHYISSITNNGTSIDFTGFKKGEVKADGSVADELVHIDIVFETVPASNTTADTVTYQVAGDRGVGDGFYVKQMEEDLRGINYGFYNRVELPNTPAQSAVTGTTYDMYHIVATKDGSSSSQIHGVDNLIEIYIAFAAGDADGVIFENQLNGYTGSVGFAPVIL